MAIEFPCVLCGKTLRIDDKFGGKMVQCPACKGKVNAPMPGGQPAPEAPHEPPPQYQTPPPPPPQYAPPPPPQYAPPPPPPPPPAYSAPPAYQPQAYQPPPQQYAPPQQQYQQPPYQAPPQQYQQPPATQTPQGAYYPPQELSPPSKGQPLPINVIFICLFSIVGGFFFQGWIFLGKGHNVSPSDFKTWIYYIELLLYGVLCSGIIVGGVLLLERNALGWLLCFFGSLGNMIFGAVLAIFGAWTSASGSAAVMEGFGNGLMFIGFPFVIWYSVKRPNFKGYFVRMPDRSDRRK